MHIIDHDWRHDGSLSSHIQLGHDGDGYHVVVNGRVLVSRESLTVAERVFRQLTTRDSFDGSECAQVADSIVQWLTKTQPA